MRRSAKLGCGSATLAAAARGEACHGKLLRRPGAPAAAEGRLAAPPTRHASAGGCLRTTPRYGRRSEAGLQGRGAWPTTTRHVTHATTGSPREAEGAAWAAGSGPHRLLAGGPRLRGRFGALRLGRETSAERQHKAPLQNPNSLFGVTERAQHRGSRPQLHDFVLKDFPARLTGMEGAAQHGSRRSRCTAWRRGQRPFSCQVGVCSCGGHCISAICFWAPCHRLHAPAAADGSS